MLRNAELWRQTLPLPGANCIKDLGLVLGLQVSQLIDFFDTWLHKHRLF